jgi:hypothetical protein
LRGGKNPPWWAAIIEIGQFLNIPPWQVEAECTADWWNRIAVYIEERARWAEVQKKRGKK